MREDLIYLRDTSLADDTSFTDTSRRQFAAHVNGSIAKISNLSPADFALDVAQAVALSGNGHTEAAVDRFLNHLPYRAWWFADGLYIVTTRPDYRQLLGARIEKLGPITPEQALQLVAPFISGTAERVRTVSPAFLGSPSALYRIAATLDPKKAEITVRLKNGGQSTLTLAALGVAEPQPGSNWSVLIPRDPIASDRWPHVLDGVQKLPSIFGEPVNVDSEWSGVGGDVLYLRLYERQISSLEDKLVGILSDQVVTRKPKYVIVDLRFNTGGDFLKSTLFAQALPRLIPQDGRILVLIGHVTFSSAIAMASMLKANGGDKVSFVGERMGDRERFWAEGRFVPLPNSRIPVRASPGMQDWGAGCKDSDPCTWQARAFGVRNISLDPDIEVHTTFANYAAGYDPVLTAALNRMRN